MAAGHDSAHLSQTEHDDSSHLHTNSKYIYLATVATEGLEMAVVVVVVVVVVVRDASECLYVNDCAEANQTRADSMRS